VIIVIVPMLAAAGRFTRGGQLGGRPSGPAVFDVLPDEEADDVLSKRGR
jgi:hypothetical protein